MNPRSAVRLAGVLLLLTSGCLQFEIGTAKRGYPRGASKAKNVRSARLDAPAEPATTRTAVWKTEPAPAENRTYFQFGIEHRIYLARGALVSEWAPSEVQTGAYRFQESALALPFRLSLDFRRGPRFWLDLAGFPFIPRYHIPERIEDIAFSLVDFGYTALRMRAAWGTVSVDLGLRHAFVGFHIWLQDRWPEPDIHFKRSVDGIIPTVGGSLDWRPFPGALSVDARLYGGFGFDGSGGGVELGITLHPERTFQLRLGYALAGLLLVDELGSTSEEYLRVVLHACIFEMRFRL